MRRLLVDGGTTVLRKVFDNKHPPTKLAANLHLEKNKSSLDDLFAKGFLTAQQRILLFPSDGSKPDSKTFDISLLFLLLTEICGLSPPDRTGWNHKPHAKNKSLPANLVRIRLFRNKLLHTAETRIDTRLFNELCKEISGVLVSLGLNQEDINKLITERCGEEDYLDVLFKWADREKEIKTKLEEVHQGQTKMLKAVEKVDQTQQEQQKMLQDTNKAVETAAKKVCQSQQEQQKILQDTKTAVETTAQKVCQTQQEHRTLLEDANAKLEQAHGTQQTNKSKLETIHQTTAKTRETVETVYHTQLEDHETLQENKSKLDNAHQTQVKTQNIVERLRQAQLEDRETLQYSKSTMQALQETQSKAQDTFEIFHQIQLEDRETLQELHQTQSKTQKIVQGVVKAQEEHFETFRREVKQAVDSFKEGRDAGAEEQVLQNLAKSEFKGDIEYLVGRYQEGTREWVFDEVENWLDDRNSVNRVMVISSIAGMGKSVISAVICKRMQEAGRLSGSHFCQHNNARYRNPQLMLQSLACHLYHALPEYKQALVKQLSRNLGKDLYNMGVEELFALLFKEPLSTVADPGRNMLMVIDGLDESDYQERNELLDILANHLCKLPCWIRFLCTTRPERNIAEALKHMKPFQLESNDDKNMEDIKLFIENGTHHLITPKKKGAIVEKLVEKSEGLMLYAYFLVLFIEENKSVLDQENLDDSLPLAISSAYHSYFKRLEKELKKEVGINVEDFLNLLSAVVASREPMPIDFASELLAPNASSPLARRKLLKAISSVSSLLPIHEGCLHVFHKSVIDWLTDTSCYGEHDFSVDEKDGHRILASLCANELDHLKEEGVRDAQFSATEKYALDHGVRHIFQLDKDMRSQSLEECVQAYVTDIEVLYAKICLNYSTAAEDILWLQSSELSQDLSAESDELLKAIMFLLRKHYSTFMDHPRVFFQTLLNEGGTVLSKQASKCLEDKYAEIAYLEYVDKEAQEKAPQARFVCSSEVICFDVSPELDYMVCECKDDLLNLWSLRTGKLVWERPVKLKKHCYHEKEGYRKSPSSPVMLCYRSVVFHPTKKVVLPGILSYAYAMSGELIPLFPKSTCSFTVCSISNSGDETAMLSNCLDDARCLVLWSLENGSEITRITRGEDILSFACSQDGSMLAISHSTGSICLVDVNGDFKTLAQVTTPKVCGMIKFSPDRQFLFCCHASLADKINHCVFKLKVTRCRNGTFLLQILGDKVSYKPLEYESRSEAGFLSGDPLSCIFERVSEKNFEVLGNDYFLVEEAFMFVLSKQSVLKYFPGNSGITMLSPVVLRSFTNSFHHDYKFVAEDIKFSLNGELVYVVAKERTASRFVFDFPSQTFVDMSKQELTIMAWDVSSGELKAELSIERGKCSRLVSVENGILFTTKNSFPELWNFELTECIRRWPNLRYITEMMPISEKRVACVGKENDVNVLDTTSPDVTPIPFSHEGYESTILRLEREAIACNSRCQLLSTDRHSVQLADSRGRILWRKPWSDSLLCCYSLPGMFSPTEKLVVISAKTPENDQSVHLLCASTGKTCRTLCRATYFFDCKFISYDVCIIDSQDSSCGLCLRLFNIKSADLLSVIVRKARTYCLAVCPLKRLVAFDVIVDGDSKRIFKLGRVKLPSDKGNRNSKR